ncbi:MAG: sigma 54-interacting transcriptional regulator, partial [Planctomycetota bacterium]
MSEAMSHFDDRESAKIAEAVLAVVGRRCGRYCDGDAAWEAFIDWRGRGEGDYLRRIRAEGRYIFYSVVQDLYVFAEHVCGEDVSEDVGRQLTDALLADHVPELLQSTLAETGALPEQIIWLVEQFVGGTCGVIYALEFDRQADRQQLRGSWRYRQRRQMVDYLKRSGHDPERAFVYSFHVFCGALGSLLARVVHGYGQEQLRTELSPPGGSFVLQLKAGNRFHYENLIDILLGYVRRLRERTAPERQPASGEAALHLSDAMKRTWDRMRRAAASDETVLLCGESGTGKSYYARRIHEMSARRDGPFVEVGLTSDVGSDNLIQSNLFGHVRGAFTGASEDKRGLFSLADGGTMFLDEVGDASPELQAKLLRAIETKRFKMLGGVEDLSVDVRIIAATNRDMPEMVRRETFREDLYYRLNVIPIVLPPLRRRGEDLPALAERLFERVSREAKKADVVLSGEALRVLSLHDWPGNVRELENALRHAVAFTDQPEVRPDCLPEPV